MTVIPPPVGAKIFTCGYPEGTAAELSSNHLEVRMQPYVSHGMVQELHLGGRDKNLPFPCFRSNLRIEGGMSGGPVFHEDGHLCGLAVSSFNCTPNEEPISYVALLWPLFGFSIAHTGDKEPFYKQLRVESGLLTALDLAENGMIQVEGRERLRKLPGGEFGIDLSGC